MSRYSHGITAGAVGTSFLNVTTYLDMALRGRPASSVPEQDVDRLAQLAGISLGEDEETAATRRSAIGALMGLLTGMGVGAVYGLVRPLARGVPQPVATVAVALGTMAATDGASAALGAGDPRTWSAADWASDLIPHLVFGAGVVRTFDALDG
jgi:hypothetical protein